MDFSSRRKTCGRRDIRVREEVQGMIIFLLSSRAAAAEAEKRSVWQRTQLLNACVFVRPQGRLHVHRSTTVYNLCIVSRALEVVLARLIVVLDKHCSKRACVCKYTYIYVYTPTHVIGKVERVILLYSAHC